jgi:hypothetical protein
MATGETPTPRGFQDYVDAVAVAGLVLGGLLVSVCGPLLRKRNEALRAELAGAELGEDLAEDLGGEHVAGGEVLGEDLAGQAPAPAYANGAAAADELAGDGAEAGR